MARQWTQQQNNAIYATDGSVLVSAAAGSGKTAVLVERVIQMITRQKNPIDVDRLLIVTFTRAAAAEMRERILIALTNLLEDDPYNPNLLKQRQLLANAQISTIDSFCSDIVREYFHTLGISRDFRVADEGELQVLKNSALDTAFEHLYKTGGEDFYKLLDAFSSKSGDIKLRNVILKISEFLSTQPFPNKWLDNMLSNYKAQPIAKTVWGKIIIDYSKSAVAHAINLTENSIKKISEDEKLNKSFLPILESDLAFFNILQKKLYSNSWDEIAKHIYSFEAGRMVAPRGYKENQIKIAVSNSRTEVKETVTELKKYFSWSEDEAQNEIKELHSLVITMFALEKEYLKELDSLKNKKNILSFADIESLTVKLLAEAEGDGYKKTAQGYEISSRYDSVMVDEFQDVNDVQDLIFKCVSNDENNLFAVGDVKQSIYGFRQAKPEIFMNRKDTYKKFDEKNPQYPATIILDKNFRSRKEVCDSVNFIFSKLMTKTSAQMDYGKDEMLNTGAEYPDSDCCNFEIDLIEKSIFPDMDSSEIEAYAIAKKIHQMINSGFLIKDGNVMRKATYGDFAIIIRSLKGRATTYVNTLINCGIPAYSENKENSLDATEIKIMLNLLRVIDNPTLDIPLLSVMCSPIYGFTADELAVLRANTRYSNLYTSVLKFAKNNKKAERFIKELEFLRTYSYTCSVNDLINKVYELTAFGAITSAVKGGADPMRNLNILKEYAKSFEANGYKTLSDFVTFIDKLIENGAEIPTNLSNNGELNRVRVLSIHASKGLEYPVCFLADTSHQFNKRDLNDDILMDSHAGLGIKRKNGVCRYNTLPRLSVQIELSKNLIAEELRVLYVALTRAREKLIVVSSQNNVEKYLTGLYSKIIFDKIIEPYSVINSKSISDWIMLSALTHPSLNTIRKSINNDCAILPFDNVLPWDLKIIDSPDMIFDDIKGVEVEKSDSNELLKELKQLEESNSDYAEILKKNLAFKYKNADIIRLPQKVSASQVAHDRNNEYFEKILLKPKFLNKEVSTSIERGTAHHRFLQFCNFENARADIESEINKLVITNYLSKQQAELIDKTSISSLLQSDLFDRIINSKMVLREEQFTAKIAPSAVFDEYMNLETDAKIIIQGAVDIAFEENGKLVVVDYKTDRVGNMAKLVDLYSKQLELYKEAMAQATELEVAECVICSIHLNDYISV